MAENQDSLSKGLGFLFALAVGLVGVSATEENAFIGFIVGAIIGYIIGSIIGAVLSGVLKFILAAISLLFVLYRLYRIFSFISE